MKQAMEELLTEEEIKEVVFSVDKDSVASPDGSLAIFYKKYWEVTK